MDLEIQDVSGILNVPISTLEQWLEEGKIPAYKVEEKFCFGLDEIENWVMTGKFDSLLSRQSQGGHPKQRIGNLQFSLYRSIHRGDVIDDVISIEKEGLIREVTMRIAQKVGLDAEGLCNLLLDREALMPTAINNAIAVPHTRDFLLEGHFDLVTMVFPRKPLEYGSLDGKPVGVLFFLFACEDKRHLHLLSKISHFASSEENRRFLLSKPNKKAVLEYVKKWEAFAEIRVL